MRLICTIALAAFAFSGVAETMDKTLNSLKYFTYLSNSLVFLVMSAQAVLIAINLIQKRQGNEMLRIPAAVKGWNVLCIVFVFLTVFLVLSPFEGPGDFQDARVHYLVPLFTVLEFLLFEERGRLKRIYPLCWGVTPLVYYGYVLILFKNRIRFGSNRFPYFFMNHILYGWGFVMKILLALLAVFIVTGYLLCLADQAILWGMKRAEKKAA